MYNNYNPYFNQPRFQQPVQVPQSQIIDNGQYIQPQQPIFNKQSVLQGKQVDSIDVVKATDVPLDGSVSYFALTDGSAIVTKQLQLDGTSKIVVFKPVDEQKETIRYLTSEDLENALGKLNLDEIEDVKEEIQDIRRELKDLKKKKGE